MKEIGELLVGKKVKCEGTKIGNTDVPWIILEHDHEGDPGNSTTLMMETVYFSRAFDAKEPKSENLNFANYGNYKYVVSNILQWLNSDADTWMWYEPQHATDHPPDTTDYVSLNPYESDTGFLKKLPKGFKDNLLEISKTAYNYEENTQENVNRKIHLLSLEEVNLPPEEGIETSGIPYEFFSDNASRIAKYHDKSVTYWHLRTCFIPDSGFIPILGINEEGKRTSAYPYKARGIRPICAIPKSTMVSDKPDENGVYSMYFQEITPDNPNNPDEPDTPMDGIWRTPKTNWTELDAFNLKDYKRIRNNLLFLRNKMSDIWEEFTIQNMGNDPTDPGYIWKVKHFNAIEENLDIINQHSLIVKNYGYKQTFYQNGVFIGFSELNRIERATLQMKQIIDGWEAGLRKLSFRLGFPKGLYL